MDKEKEGGGFYPAASVSVRPTIEKSILAMEDENAVGGSSSSSSKAMLAKTQDRVGSSSIKAILANTQDRVEDEEKELEYNS